MFTKIKSSEKTLTQVVLVGGFILMILGTYANLSAIDEKRSGISTEANEISRLSQNDIRLPESLVDKIARKELEKNLIPSVRPSLVSLDSKIIQPKLPFEDPKRVEEEKPKLPIENQNINSADKMVNIEKPKLPVETVEEPADKMVNIEKSKLPVETVEEPKKLSSEISDDKVRESLPSQMKSENSNPIKEKPMVPVLNNKIPTEIEKPKQPNNIEQTLDPKLNENENKIVSLDTKLSNLTSNNIIDKEAIKKEEEIAAEEDSKDKKLEIAEAELKKTKEMLEKKVDELKQEIVKQNEETQKLVNEKLSNIIEQVKEIKEEVKEEKKIEQQKIDEKNDKTKIQPNENEVLKQDLPKVDTDIKFSASKGSLVAQLNKKIEEAQKLSKSDNLTEIKRNDSVVLTVPENQNVSQKEVKEPQNKPESPKSNIEPPKEKVYEPLSYKTGELLNKINETQMKGNDKRGPMPLPLLINSTNNNKLIPNIITNIQSYDLNNTVNIKSPLENNTVNKELNISGYIPPQITNKITESNIEAIRRDILEIKEKTLTESDEKLNREKRDLKNFEYNLSIQNINENCLPNCIKTEPSQQNMNLIIEELNNGLKMMTGGRDLKSVTEKNNEES